MGLLIILTILGLYSLAGIFLFLSFFKKFRFPPPPAKVLPVSIVIPFRDEKRNLSKLFDSLIKQDLPASAREIILVDDHSVDKGFEYLKMLARDEPGWKVIRNRYSPGKKQALLSGVEEARHAWILTTDADCTLPPAWISTMMSFPESGPGIFRSGPVKFQAPYTLAGAFQVLETAAMQSVTAALFFLKAPAICNGANMAFQKSLFLDSYPHLHPSLSSGDDVFLLHRAKLQSKQGLDYVYHRSVTVTTDAGKTIPGIFRQRLRWASKANLYRDRASILLTFSVFAGNLAMAAAGIMLIFQPVLQPLLPALMALKAGVDLLLVTKHLWFTRQLRFLVFFPAIALIYPVYITFTGLFSIIRKPG